MHERKKYFIIAVAIMFTGIVILCFLLYHKTVHYFNDKHFYYTIGVVNIDSADSMMEKACEMIPKSVVESFYQDEGRIIIANENIYKVRENDISSGLYNSRTNTIWIRSESESSFNCLNTVLHEFGHYVDAKLGNVSSTSEWQQIYDSEKNSSNYKDDYYKNNSAEFFAEEFERYCFGESITQYCFKAQSYMKKCVKSLSIDV